MIPGWIDKPSSGLAGRKTGQSVCAPCAGRRAAKASFSPGFDRILSHLLTVAVRVMVLGLTAILLVPNFAFSLTQGDLIVNSASLSSPGITTATSSVTVTVVIRTPSVIEILTYAPLLPGAELVNVPLTTFRTGSAVTDPFNNVPAPVPVGAATPIDLNQPVPLAAASQLHQGEPLFIRLTDKDQNLRTTQAETVLVTVSNPTNGDVEVLQLTETTPNTGVFVGCLPTVTSTATTFNGSVSVKEGDRLSVNYVDIQDNSDTSATALLIDPYGIVFDSSSGLPVNGATITMINTATGQPATVFGDDGVSAYPATLTSGGSTTDSSGRVYSFQPGGYRFPFVLPGSYQYRITPPTGYGSPSSVATSTIQALPGSPFTIVNGSRGEIFVINPGPSLRIDIPLDPAASRLWLQKSAGKDSAGHGDFIPYQLTVTNGNTTNPVLGTRVTDTLPIGLRLLSGSVRINAVPAGDPAVSVDGRTLTFTVGIITSGSAAMIEYVTEVTAGTRLGAAVNSAIASSGSGETSNIAQATVTIKDDFLRTRSTLMGRVGTGACGNASGEGPGGVEGVRIYLEDGSFVISDKQGLFHFEGVRSGLHVVQLDLDSLPEGYEAYACTENSRFAGRAFSQFVETQGGTLWRTDFHLRSKAKPVPGTGKGLMASAPEKHFIDVQPEKGVAALELVNTTDGQKILFRVSMRGNDLPVQSGRLNVILPEGVAYEPGSSLMNDHEIVDPLLVEKTQLVYRLSDLSAGWQREITFRGRATSGSKPSILETQAYLVVDDAGKTTVLTPPAETTLQLNKNVEIFKMPEIVLRPHFPTFGDELNAEDREKLDELARLLIGLRTEQIHVTGHTDNQPIAPRSRAIHSSNRALSMARAKSIGRYLMDKLKFAPEKLSLDGKGDEVPVSENRTEAGRALNRRVEVRVTASRVIERSHLHVIKELSGEQRTETAGANNAPVKESPGTLKTAVPAAVTERSEGASAATRSNSGLRTATDVPAVPSLSDTAPGALTYTAAPATMAADTLPISTGAAAVQSPVATEAPSNSVKDREGVLSPGENDILPHKINGVRVCLDSTLTPHLLVDNKEVPADRIGFTMKDNKSGKTIYSYIGVDFGDRGDHTIQFQGTDPFGNARFKQTFAVKRSGEIATIRLKSAEGNVADGKTPVRVRLELYDADGNRIPAETELEIRESSLKPLKQPDLFALPPVVGISERVQLNKDGDALFQPVTNSGLYRAILAHNTATVEVETYVQPKLRDWILVGLAEGTLGYNTASGTMESLQGTDMNEDLYKDGRIALFAKGQIQGKWLLTMAYDTAKTKGNSGDGLFQTINPDTYYTLYGDASQQQYDAASAKKLYLKIEREQFYAMFGDYDAGLTVTELSRYSRRMTGIKTEFQSRNFEINAFASETEQTYARDEIPGDGTSGIYRLSRKNIVPNTEKISIEVRDRFRSEILISSRTLGRFSDYSIDYDTGAVIFKEPIHSRDNQFNPTIIVAEYEVVTSGGKDYTYGGRAGFKLLDQRLKVGGSYIHEGQGDRSSNLYGADTSIRLGQSTKLRVEFAASDYSAGSATRSGNAYLAEVTHTSKMFDAKAYIREQEAGFGLGQQPGSEAGTRKVGVEGAYRLNENYSTNATLYRQYNLLTNATRDVAEAKLNYTDKRYGASIGVLHADDRLGDGTSHNSTQLTLGGKVQTLYDRLTLTLDHAQSIGSNSNSDFPTRTAVGAEFIVTKNLTLLAAQELTWGTGATTQNTRLGMRSTPWKGAAVTGSVERQFNENDERVFANAGLKQTWQVSDAWKIDAGLDRSQSLARASHYQFNTSVPPASGGTENFTAISGGATYQVKQLTWDNRLEFRFADSENKWGVMSGLINEVDSRWAWSGRAQVFQTSAASNGIDSTKANLRYGLVFRPPQTTWIVLNRLDYLYDKQSGGPSAGLNSWRLVNNLVANYRPRKEMQISLQYGAKYVRDTIGDNSYSGFTDHIGFETRFDITKSWDIGIRGSLLHSWYGGQYDYSCGPSAGYNLFDNAWISAGYNLWGFEDKDFSSAAYTAQGPYVRLRVKFDQQTVKDAAAWLNKQ